jgi:hypothetical protein
VLSRDRVHALRFRPRHLKIGRKKGGDEHQFIRERVMRYRQYSEAQVTIQPEFWIALLPRPILIALLRWQILTLPLQRN